MLREVKMCGVFLQNLTLFMMKSLLLLSLLVPPSHGLATHSRRSALKWFGAVTAGLGAPQKAFALADESKIPDTLDIDNFLRSGQVSNPMGVSGQAGKSRPETGVILRCVPY